MNRSAITCWFLAGLALLAAGKPDDAKNDRDRFEGTWLVVSQEEDGQKVAEQDLQTFRLVFDDDRYEAKNKDEVVEAGTFRLDPSKSPKSMDIKIQKGPDAGKNQVGIYRFVGEMLELCFAPAGAKDRPREFSAKEGSHSVLFVLKKEKS